MATVSGQSMAMRGLSSRSVRRYCVVNGKCLRHSRHLLQSELNDVVERTLSIIDPSYGPQ